MGRRKSSIEPYTPAPRNWGLHPDFERNYKKHMALVRHHARKGLFDISITGKEVLISELADPRHPEVVIIPRNRYINVVYRDSSSIGFEQILFPFSSTNFYANIYDDLDKNGVFAELGRSQVFFRLGGIVQLGYLVPPIPEEFGQKKSITYMFPQFPHTRWIHSLLTAILMDIILARNGFSEKGRAPQVLTAAYHDSAIPAGGDSVVRMDPENLSEEKNFSWLLNRNDLDSFWTERFGFDVNLAQGWVRGEGTFGRLLDAVDKICYTALDCYWLGSIKPGLVRSLCLRNPLIMDVWQDIVFTPDRSNFGFSSPERLFLFLLLRVYEHKELLLNPYARTFDFRLEKLLRPLYKRGIIKKEDLLTHDDDWLYAILKKHYPEEVEFAGWRLLEPLELPWRRFETAEDQQKFCAKLGDKVDHIDNITGFNTGLYLPVFHEEKVIPIRDALPEERVELLEEIANSTRGYYVYYRA